MISDANKELLNVQVMKLTVATQDIVDGMQVKYGNTDCVENHFKTVLGNQVAIMGMLAVMVQESIKPFDLEEL